MRPAVMWKHDVIHKTGSTSAIRTGLSHGHRKHALSVGTVLTSSQIRWSLNFSHTIEVTPSESGGGGKGLILPIASKYGGRLPSLSHSLFHPWLWISQVTNKVKCPCNVSLHNNIFSLSFHNQVCSQDFSNGDRRGRMWINIMSGFNDYLMRDHAIIDHFSLNDRGNIHTCPPLATCMIRKITTTSVRSFFASMNCFDWWSLPSTPFNGASV